ncbi:MAG: leucine-rich repeat domain-containing protein [Christensenellales bacterium]|jgi:hypothetical protein
MKTAWRFFVIALLAMALLLPGLTAGAEQAHFEFDPSTGAITGYTGSGGDVIVPDSIGGVPVTRIGERAFSSNNAITSVTLPQGIRRIEHGAFYFCENLRAIELPDGLEVIAPYALFACGALERLNVPAAVAYIGDYAVSGCYNLREINFAGEAPLMGEEAFANGADDRRIVVPAEDQMIYEAMLGAPCEPGGARASVDRAVAEDDFLFDAATGVLTGYVGDAAYVPIPAAIGGTPVREISEKAFFGDKGIVRMDLPEGLQTIGDQAFYASALVGVRLPESLRSIGDQAFGAAQLMELALPQGVEEMGESAFASNALRSLALPEGLHALPNGAFERNTRLGDLSLPASLTRIGAGAFAGCNQLTYVIFAGRDLPEIEEGAFADCPIADIDIGWDADKAQVQAARDALSTAGLSMDQATVWRADRADAPPYPMDGEFTFDDATGAVTSYQGDVQEMTMYWNFYAQDSQLVSIRELGAGLFEGSTLRRFFVPHSDELAIIGERAFADSQLEEIYLFDSVTTIGAAAFRGCGEMTRIEIPASVAYIGAGAFEGCTALSEVIFVGGSPIVEADAFKDCPSLHALTLPAGAQPNGDLGTPPQIIRIADDASDEQVEAMAQALHLPWYLELRRASEPDAFVRMPDTANAETDFEFDAETGTITKYIGASPAVVVPRAIAGVPVTRIDALAFSDATVASYLAGDADNAGLTEVILPETLREIGDSAFLQSSALERVVCYGPIDRLGNRAFENCTALTSVSFVNGIREIDLYAFHLAEALTEVRLGEKIEAIGEAAFRGTGLVGALTLTAPTVGQAAFWDCKAVTTIRVTESVSSIGMGAFIGMDALERIYFDRPDVEILGYGNFQFSEEMIGFKLCLPEHATDDEVAAFVSALDQNLLPGADMVVRENYD